MRFLLIPGNNSLSHVAKCLAVEEQLTARGHQVLVAVSSQHAAFLEQLGKSHSILPDIQENDGAPAPTLAWFSNIKQIEHCIRSEIDLMREFRPDRVVGVFRFTTKTAAGALGIPYDSLVCGCMMPDIDEVLGFAQEEPGTDCQFQYLENFFRFAGKKLSVAANGFGTSPVSDARQLLEGDRTFLWDFPEFMPIPDKPDRFHVGPVQWAGWPGARQLPDDLPNGNKPLAVISFGTCCGDLNAAQKIVNCLLASNYNVIIAAGGQQTLGRIHPKNGSVRVLPFAPMKKLLARTDLLITHGGQMTLFESLSHAVPALVMPFQPEQAHNGVCMERIGCGRRMVSGIPFKGDRQVYAEALADIPENEICKMIHGLMECPETAARLERVQHLLKAYDGAVQLTDRLEQG